MASDVLGSIARRLAPGRPSPTIRSHTPAGPTSRPPLVFVHGVMTGAWAWEENWVPAAVARGWPCHAIELGGPDGDDGSGRRWTVSDCEEDVLEAMGTLPRPPVLVAHSTASVAVTNVLAEQETVAGVLVAPIPPFGGYKFPLHLLRRHPTDLVRVSLMRPLPPRRDYFFSDRIDEATAERFRRRMEPASMRTSIELGLPRRPPEIDVPVLVLGAEDDTLVDPVDVVRTARTYGSQARMFRGMGHAMMLDAGWRAPLEVMLHWLEDEVLG